MPLTPGTRLGPYEIVAPLGAGGMGEVYRARDTRLERDVAIKSMPAAFASDPARRARFETEARAVAALSHPNVLAIHDLGADGEIVYAVMELVEGQTLRELLEDGALSSPRTLALAVQIAHGLAAAHDRGIVHRDLKPENVIVTPEGRAKILDFGLARLDAPSGTGSQSLAPTLVVQTEPGVVLGTIGYMSPEQVRGQVADARSDLFALGAVIYEMLTGRRAFHAESSAETMSAILREDPPALTSVVPNLAPAIERIVQRCLEKLPAARFRSASDLAFALEALSSGGSSGSHANAPAGRAIARPAFRRLTFRNGNIESARFTPDGTGLVYGAAWEGGRHEIFSSRIGSPESRSLGLPQGNLLSMSASGEMAVLLDFQHTLWFEVSGTLARVGLAGGGMRPIQKDVAYADWSPDGKSMAIIRKREERCVLEYPPGKVLVESPVYMGHCRVSPDGKKVAFARYHRSGEGEGSLCVVDASGVARTLVPMITNLNGVAWSPSGDAVWWSGINERLEHGIWSEGLDGTQRELYLSPVRIRLQDVRRNGGALLAMDDVRIIYSTGTTAEAREVESAWFDGSFAVDLSADGSQVLFVEVAEAENPHYACYARPFDGSPAVRIGSGNVCRLSADAQWVVGIVEHPAHGLMLYPTGFGEEHSVPFTGLERILWATFHPDGRSLFVVGIAPGGPRRLYRLAIEGGAPELLYDRDMRFERFAGLPFSPDGGRVVLRRASGEYVSYAMQEKAETPLPALAGTRRPLRFDAGGSGLYVSNVTDAGTVIERLDLATGELTPWRRLSPSNPLGVIYLSQPVVAADGSRFAYSFLRIVSNLYLVEGLG
jgi:eukaryotic-like serine/threonine-protein kinase